MKNTLTDLNNYPDVNKRKLLEKFLESKTEDCPGWCNICEYVEICDTIERMWRKLKEQEEWEKKEQEEWEKDEDDETDIE